MAMAKGTLVLIQTSQYKLDVIVPVKVAWT